METSVKDILTRLSGVAHRGGAFNSDVLMAIAEVLPSGDLKTLETGCGKSTIMFSNLALKHYVFAYDDRQSEGSSVLMVQNDKEFRQDHTIFVYGPTQQTLRSFLFTDDDMFDVILIDGPHGYPFPDLEYALLYDKLKVDGILIIDDVHIPSIGKMYDVLREDRMYEEIGVFSTTGLLRRTAIEGVPNDGDHWYEQSYNYSRFPLAMDKYHTDRTVALNRQINLADPASLEKYAIKSIERSPKEAAAQTTDIGATLEFNVTESAGKHFTLEIQYKSIYEDACRDAVVLVGGVTTPLPYSSGWSKLEIMIERPASGRVIVTFVHPSAIPEHDRETKRYEFRRLGSLLRSIAIRSEGSGHDSQSQSRWKSGGMSGLIAKLFRKARH